MGFRIFGSDPTAAPRGGRHLRRNQAYDLERGFEVNDTPAPVTLEQ